MCGEFVKVRVTHVANTLYSTGIFYVVEIFGFFTDYAQKFYLG